MVVITGEIYNKTLTNEALTNNIQFTIKLLKVLPSVKLTYWYKSDKSKLQNGNLNVFLESHFEH